ncbi:hypothetical protein [Cellulomonas sp. NPDC089187]|uniref:hypothetical protein n=1 Tax=Cellulomonas sp. NPDC089187 TaxID=3154970 RepID=UPI0034236042
MTPIVQWLVTEWTVASRGAPGATRRNATPLGLRLPDPHDLPERGPRPRVRLHAVGFDEADDFEPGTPRPSLVDPGDLGLIIDGNRLAVRFQPTFRRRSTSAPAHPTVRLDPGQWLRWQANYRLGASPCGSGGEWRYHLHTVNVHWPDPDTPVDPHVFTATPDRLVRELMPLR